MHKPGPGSQKTTQQQRNPDSRLNINFTHEFESEEFSAKISPTITSNASSFTLPSQHMAEDRTSSNNTNRPPCDQQPKSIWKLCGQHKIAIFWSLFTSIGTLVWGYDVILSNGLYSIRNFGKDFGDPENGGYVVSNPWQIVFSICPYIGALFGSIIAGHFSDKVGRKTPIACGSIISIGGVFIQIFSEKSGTLLAGKLLHGSGLGCFLTVVPSYAVEVVPTNLRFITASSIQLFIGLGQLLATVVIRIFGDDNYAISYKIPITIQLGFLVVLLAGINFAPESPWFLLRAGNFERCEKTLEKLGFADGAIEEMQDAVEVEGGNHSELRRTSWKDYFDCFRGSNLRRTEIATGSLVVSQLVGIVFVTGYSTYFFQMAFSGQTQQDDAGLVKIDSKAFALFMGVSGLELIGVVAAWFTIANTKIGRRRLMIWGTLVLACLSLLVGIFDVIPTHAQGLACGQSACLIVFALVYFFSTGTAMWAIFAEVPSGRLRARTNGVAVFGSSIFGILMNVIVPVMVNPDEANLSGKVGFLFAGTSILSLMWIYFRIPEIGGRSFSDLDILFHEKIPARKFESYEFDTVMT